MLPVPPIRGTVKRSAFGERIRKVDQYTLWAFNAQAPLAPRRPTLDREPGPRHRL